MSLWCGSAKHELPSGSQINSGDFLNTPLAEVEGG